MIDFDALVLAPNQAVWSVPVRVQPPSAAAFDARGIFASQTLNVDMMEGGVFSDVQNTLAIRLSEWPAVPARGWRITFKSTTEVPPSLRGVTMWVSDPTPDGQGAMHLQLRKTAPAESLPGPA